jgi:protein-S-isoprenylcysteine O-methyltransferase Ste14
MMPKRLNKWLLMTIGESTLVLGLSGHWTDPWIWVSFGIALAYSLLIVRRVMFEDAFLVRNLPGYADYTHRVTRRLIPRTW